MNQPPIVENPYRERVERALGSRDPLQVLAATPGALAKSVSATTRERLRARPFEGKWTPNEILGHLADAEWAWGWRIRTVLSQERPAILGYDQEGGLRVPFLAVGNHRAGEEVPAARKGTRSPDQITRYLAAIGP